jgi:hypothetical protein
MIDGGRSLLPVLSFFSHLRCTFVLQPVLGLPGDISAALLAHHLANRLAKPSHSVPPF